MIVRCPYNMPGGTAAPAPGSRDLIDLHTSTVVAIARETRSKGQSREPLARPVRLRWSGCCADASCVCDGSDWRV